MKLSEKIKGLSKTSSSTKTVHVTPQGQGRYVSFSITAQIILSPGIRGTDVIPYITTMKDDVDNIAHRYLLTPVITSAGYVSLFGNQRSEVSLNYSFLIMDKGSPYSSDYEKDRLDILKEAYGDKGWLVK